jgi:hypothetical protein
MLSPRNIRSVAGLLLLASSGTAFAQTSVEAQCAGARGKTLACCQRIVTANPRIAQCDKERAVFRCTGSKQYVSPNGCGTFTR